MTDQEPLDRRLREAGRRLRDTAPSAAATEAALDTLDGRVPPSRLRWIAPLAFVAAAAAAVVGVLVVTRPEDAGRVVPADTAPPAVSTTVRRPPTPSISTTSTTSTSTTSTSTTSTTSPPPPAGPAFVGDLPLDASAAIVGCPGSFGDVAAVIPQETWPIVGLSCAGDVGLAALGPSIALPDGTTHELSWNGTAWTSEGSGTSHSCEEPEDALCAALGETVELYHAARPLPPAWLVEDPHYLPGVDADDFVLGLGVSVTGDAEAFAAELGAALQGVTSGDPVPRVETEVPDHAEATSVTVTLSGIPDDSSSRHAYVVSYLDLDGTLTPTGALRYTYCDRGVTTDGLCL